MKSGNLINSFNGLYINQSRIRFAVVTKKKTPTSQRLITIRISFSIMLVVHPTPPLPWVNYSSIHAAFSLRPSLTEQPLLGRSTLQTWAWTWHEFLLLTLPWPKQITWPSLPSVEWRRSTTGREVECLAIHLSSLSHCGYWEMMRDNNGDSRSKLRKINRSCSHFILESHLNLHRRSLLTCSKEAPW